MNKVFQAPLDAVADIPPATPSWLASPITPNPP